LFFENGPYKVNETTGAVSVNPWSWNTRANLLYVDQPVGTGFSYADFSQDMVTDEKQVVAQMLAFMKEFYGFFPQYAALDLVIFAESYGGHYGPSIARGMVESSSYKFPLKAVGIGNGWVNAATQYPGYYEFASNWTGPIETTLLRAVYETCWATLEFGNNPFAQADCNIYQEVVISALSAHFGYDINVYNVYIPCKGSLCYNMNAITNLMNTASVQQSIGAPANSDWEACSTAVYEDLLGDILRNCEVDVPVILAAGVRMTFYNGRNDFICNFRGTQDTLNGMVWPGQKTYLRSPTRQMGWGTVQSTNQTSDGWLDFVTIYNAGHLVPHDQPQVALMILDAVLSGKTF